MRIPGKTFSENYALSLKIHKALGNEGMEEHLMKWATEVVDELKLKGDGTFKVVITLHPEINDNNVNIQVIQTDDKRSALDSDLSPPFKNVIRLLSFKSKIADCIKEINERLDPIKELVDEKFIEIDGKKYKLTAV